MRLGHAARKQLGVLIAGATTLDFLLSYDWPGNIRELQNVIERSVILSAGDVFSIDELWLSRESSPLVPEDQTVVPSKGEPRSEREIIEAALAESKSRVSGPAGAAAKLKIAPSTLAHRIKALNINKASSSSAEPPTTIPTKFSPALVATLSLVVFQRVVIVN